MNLVLLSEGVIKLPKARDEIVKFGLTSFFGYAWNRVHKTLKDDSHALDHAKILIQAESKRYDIDLKAAAVKMKDVDTVMKTFKFHEVIYKNISLKEVKVKFSFKKIASMSNSPGIYYDRPVGYICISLFNLLITRLSTYSVLQAAIKKLPEFIGFIEHELTHFVQHKSDLHDDQLKMHKGYDDPLKMSDYYLSPIEFDSMIRTSIGRIKRLILIHKDDFGFKEDQLIRVAIGAEPPPEWMHGSCLIPFFHALKLKSPKRWSVAIKKILPHFSKLVESKELVSELLWFRRFISENDLETEVEVEGDELVVYQDGKELCKWAATEAKRIRTIVLTNAFESRYYAEYVLNGPFKLGEKVIATNAFESCVYAEYVLKGRFELGEKIIAKDDAESRRYAEYIAAGCG